jgi:hypothetical protein
MKHQSAMPAHFPHGSGGMWIGWYARLFIFVSHGLFSI